MGRIGIRGVLTAGAGLLALAGAFVAGLYAAPGPSTATRAVERGPFARRDADAPPWSTTTNWVLPIVGSLFRGRFSAVESPLDGLEAVVVTPRKDECLDDCPLTLRVIGGEAGAKTLAKIMPSLDPDLLRLVDARGMPPPVGEWLRSAEADLAQDAAEARATGDRPPTRALFIGMPRPDVAPAAWSVGLVMSDLPDPHFDAKTEDTRRPGWRLFVSRVETAGASGRTEIVVGAIAVGRSTGKSSRPIPAGATELSVAFGSLWGHFGTLCDDIRGLYLDHDGRIHGFGSDLRLRPLPESPELRGALVAMLRRA
jgi:hypothetical protein